jgi:hypothetical protein
MMKNRLKSIALAIAVVAIVIINNIGFGASDSPLERLRQRVDARPKYVRDGNVVDAPSVPKKYLNYAAGLQYLFDRQKYFDSVGLVWSENGKKIVEQKIREAISNKQLNRGVRIYGEAISLAFLGSMSIPNFDPNTNITIELNRQADITFQTATSKNYGIYGDPSFRVKFNLTTTVKFHTIPNLIIVDDVNVTINDIDLISSVEGKVAGLVRNFFSDKGEFQRDVMSRINGNSSIKSQVAGHIKSTIERLVTSDIVNQ